jgi:hypothetical protein
VFLLHNVHEREPVVFHTRWAMSYLRGPLTRAQVRELAAEQAPPPAVAAAPGVAAARPAPVRAGLEPEPELPYSRVPPQLPSSVTQVFLPTRLSLQDALRELARERRWSVRDQDDPGGYLVYEPALVGLAALRFPHAKSRQTHAEEAAYLLPLEGSSGVVDWSEGKVKLDSRDLERKPERDAFFADLPPDLGNSKRHTALKREFEDHLYYTSSIILWYNPHLKLYSEFGESEKEYQRRCRKAAEKAHDAETDKLRAKYKRELDRLEDRLQREERELEDDKIEHSARKQEELLSGVESVVSLFSGRRSSRRLSTASRKRRMTRQARADIEESEEVIEELEREIEELEEEAKSELEELAERWGELVDEMKEEEVRPRRADVRVNLFALAWIPRWEVTVAGQALSMPAFEVEHLD